MFHHLLQALNNNNQHPRATCSVFIFIFQKTGFLCATVFHATRLLLFVCCGWKKKLAIKSVSYYHRSLQFTSSPPGVLLIAQIKTFEVASRWTTRAWSMVMRIPAVYVCKVKIFVLIVACVCNSAKYLVSCQKFPYRRCKQLWKTTHYPRKGTLQMMFLDDKTVKRSVLLMEKVQLQRQRNNFNDKQILTNTNTHINQPVTTHKLYYGDVKGSQFLCDRFSFLFFFVLI